MGGLCDSISLVGFFDASLGCFEGIFGNLNFMFGRGDECFNFLDGERGGWREMKEGVPTAVWN